MTRTSLPDVPATTRTERRGRPPQTAAAVAAGLRLRSAAAAVLAEWRNDLGDAVDPAEADAVIEWIADAVERATQGAAPASGGPATSVLGRHLLERYRRALLGTFETDPGDPTTMLNLLNGVERVREAIAPDWSQYFTSRLSGPDGLDLVVEVAHDIRSPLTSILFLAETLGRGQSGDVNDLQRRQMRLIYSAALGLSTMASDVIELARGGDQLVEKEVSPFSIAEVLESVSDMVRPIAEEKGLVVRVQAPATDRRLGRSLALSRVLLNLTTNALKFTDEGSVDITTMATDRSHVEFAVRDTGHGISPDALANLYQPFRRTRARAGRSGYYFSGTGLGLAMCRKLVEAMGSELAFESSPERGTRFSFVLELPPAPTL